MSVYVGIDVHRKRSQVAVIDQDGKVLANRNVNNGVQPILSVIGGLPPGTELPGLVPFREFVEQGAPRRAALRSPQASFAFALRERQFCPQPAQLSGMRPGRFAYGQPGGPGGPSRQAHRTL
jgi:hypothetical protein